MYFTTALDGTLSMQNYQHTDLVGNFSRKTIVSATGSAAFTYGSTMNPDPAIRTALGSITPKTETLTYTLDAIRTLANN